SGIFKLQAEIAGTVAAAMKVALSERALLVATAPNDTEAYNLLLKGNFFANRNTKEDTETAIGLFKQAIKLDPSFALAWAKLSSAYQRQIYNGWTAIAEGTNRARSAAERAVSVDPNLAYAHKVLGALARDVDWAWKAARESYPRARELDPSDSLVRADLALLTEGMFGRFEP